MFIPSSETPGYARNVSNIMTFNLVTTLQMFICSYLMIVIVNYLQEEVTLAKEEWELSRLKALREEEERRAELEEDEVLYTYSRDDALNQVKKKSKANRPPTAAVRQSNRKSAGGGTPAQTPVHDNNNDVKLVDSAKSSRISSRRSGFLILVKLRTEKMPSKN